MCTSVSRVTLLVCNTLLLWCQRGGWVDAWSPRTFILGAQKHPKVEQKACWTRVSAGSWGVFQAEHGLCWSLPWSGWVVCLGSHFFFFFFFFHVAHLFLLLSPLPLPRPSSLCKPLCFSSFSSRLFFWGRGYVGVMATNKHINKSNKCLLLKREQPLTIGILGERRQNESWTHFVWGKLYLQLTITQEEKCVKLL